MWYQKYSVIISTFITVLALTFAVLFYMDRNDFAKDISINIFSGGFLSMILSIFGYLHERKHALEDFYTATLKARNNINRFKNDENIDKKMETVISMDDFDYSDLHRTFGAISFIFNDKSTRNYLHKEICQPIVEMSKAIQERAYHIRLYKNMENGNRSVVEAKINELNSLIMKEHHGSVTNQDGTVTSYSCVVNQFVSSLDQVLDGKYYEIMYPVERIKQK